MTDREAYIEQTLAKLDEWTLRIERLSRQARQRDVAAGQDPMRKIQELKARRSDAEEELQKLKDSSEETWVDTKSGFEEAWDNLGRTLDDASARFG